MRLITIIVAVLTAQSSLRADHCHQYFAVKAQPVVVQYHAKAVVVAQPVYQVQPIYSVGAYVQQQSTAVHHAQTDPDWHDYLQNLQQFREYKAYKLGLKHSEQTEVTAAGSAIRKNCASCHGSALTAPKGGVYIDADADMTDSLMLDALTRIQLSVDSPKHMPPGKQLEPDVMGALMEEFLKLRSKGE